MWNIPVPLKLPTAPELRKITDQANEKIEAKRISDIKAAWPELDRQNIEGIRKSALSGEYSHYGRYSRAGIGFDHNGWNHEECSMYKKHFQSVIGDTYTVTNMDSCPGLVKWDLSPPNTGKKWLENIYNGW